MKNSLSIDQSAELPLWPLHVTKLPFAPVSMYTYTLLCVEHYTAILPLGNMTCRDLLPGSDVIIAGFAVTPESLL